MKISHKDILKFYLGGGVPEWYLIYNPYQKLGGYSNSLDYRSANLNLMNNDHRNAQDLLMAFDKNLSYTSNKDIVGQDIQHFYDTDGKGMTAENFVNYYNNMAKQIRDYWNTNHNYMDDASSHNPLYKKMFYNRSLQNPTKGPFYNIGYLSNLENSLGSSTWLRRMDVYENEFDVNNPDDLRLHEITLADGTKAIFYKKANGDIGLFSKANPDKGSKNSVTLQAVLREPLYTFKKPEIPNIRKFQAEELPEDSKNKFKEAFLNLLNNPNLYATGRLIGTLINNNRVYDEALKAIKPNLISPYRTARQVVSDEATKLAYYRRAAEGVTKASLPMTSDADRQVAYQMEAQRAANELRALGDLADNLEIRRTSDESNLHLWANIQRENQAANANLASILDANARRHNLLALKHSAQWSSIDNYLLGIEYRKRLQLAEELALNDQIFALEQSNAKYDDPEYMKAYENLLKVLNEHKNPSGYGYDEANPDVRDARQNLARALTNLKIKLLKKLQIYNQTRHTISAKQGTKVTWKKKDDLLYKSAKDVVEHFRKMTKLAYDSISKRPKEIKLVSHPKTKKYQLGGVAPFKVYTPVALGGEVTTSTSSSTTNSKENTKDDTLDLLKNLFKEVSGKGLPIDVNTIYLSFQSLLNNYSLFGAELSTEDIASMYLQAMLQLNSVLHSKEIYDKAKVYATLNDALNEFAVTSSGRYVVLDKKGKISATETDLEKALKIGTPITNAQLLSLREYSPLLLLYNGDTIIEDVINSGMGINKIGAAIKALAGNISSSTSKIEGLSEIESKRVKAGIQLLSQTDGTPDGIYLVTTTNRNSKQLIAAALTYIENMLSPSQKAILNAHGGTKPLIEAFLTSQTSSTLELTISPLTGKAAGSSKKSGSEGDAENSAGLAFVLGLGPRELVDFNTGTSNAIRVLGIKGVLLTKSKENLGLGASLQDATKSLQGGYLEWNKATFGGSRLNSGAFSHIILNDSTIIGMDLPYTKDINGNIIPDFLLLRKMEEADLYISENNITDINEINKIYLSKGLAPKYAQDGKLNTLEYKRFAAIQATLDEDSLLDKSAILSDEVSLAGDVERDLYEEAVKKSSSNKNYDLSDGMWLTGWFSDKLYKGTIFVPYSEDIAFAALSSGEPFKQGLPDNVATILLMLYASKASTYKAPETTISQIKEN